jgi:hypothetical protein
MLTQAEFDKIVAGDKQANRYYDPAKLWEMYQQATPGKDGRAVLGDDAWMAALNPLSGLTKLNDGYAGGWQSQAGDSGAESYMEESLGQYKDGYGRTFNVIQGDEGDPNTYLKYWEPGKDGFGNITGNSSDRVVPTYRYDPATGTAVPINANTAYEGSDWVDWGRTLAKIAGTVVGAGFGGAALLGAGAAPAGTAAGGLAGSGAGLDAAAAAALAGQSAPGAGLAAATSVGAAGEAAALGGLASAGYALPTNAATIESALGTPGYGASSAGAGNAAGSIPSGASWWDAAKGVYDSVSGIPTPSLDQLIKGGKAIAPILGGLAGGGGGGGDAAPTNPMMTTSAPSKQGFLGTGVGQYDFDGYQADPHKPWLGHTNRSRAVNPNDPSAAMFGAGPVPKYYTSPDDAAYLASHPPATDPYNRQHPSIAPRQLAEGGSVEDDVQSYGIGKYDDPYAQMEATSPQGYNDPYAGMYPGPSDYVAPDAHTPGVYKDVYADMPRTEEGPMSWIARLFDGSKESRLKLAMGAGGLGLLSSLLASKTPRGYKSAMDLQNSVQGTQNVFSPALQKKFEGYFSKAPSVYQPPKYGPRQAAPKGAQFRADGGRIEPTIGSRTPLPTPTAPGAMSKEAIIRAILEREAASAAAARRAMPNPVNPRAVNDARERAAGIGLAHGGDVPGFVSSGAGGGQGDMVDARLSPGEYVWDADVVSALGDGDNATGARLLDDTRRAIREHKRGGSVDDIPPPALSPLEYLKGVM